MIRRALGLASLVLLAACGSDPVSDPDGAGATSGGGGARGGTGGTASGGTGGRVDCPEGPGRGEPRDPVDIQTVQATVVDETNQPIAELATFLCGTVVCSPLTRTDSGGQVVVGFSEPLGGIEKPAFKYGDGIRYGRFAAPLPPSEETLSFGSAATPRLPDEGAPFVAGSTIESAGVRLTLAADAMLEASPIDFPEAGDRLFRAAELPISLVPPLLAGGLELDAVFAFGPGGAVVCPEATVDLPNSVEAEAGTRFDVLVHGVDITEEFAPYGGWIVVGTAEVDETGERIVMREGGVPVISALGLRRQ